MSGRVPLLQTGGEATPRSASPSPASSYTPPRRSLARLMQTVAGTFASCLTQSLLIQQQQQQKEEAAAPAAPCRFQPTTAPSAHAPLGDPLQFNSLAAQYREDSLEAFPQILRPQPCLQGSCGRRREARSSGCGAIPHCRFPSRSSSTGSPSLVGAEPVPLLALLLAISTSLSKENKKIGVASNTQELLIANTDFAWDEESPTKISSYQRNAQEKETITKYSPVQYKSILVAHADGRNKGKTLEREFAITMNKILIDLFFSSQAICGSHYRDLQMRGKGGEGRGEKKQKGVGTARRERSLSLGG
uniref:Uncharacterized protein n=1 Tax=Aegilops tauschii TaxID=37682 RepID=M8BE70_AEGTA